MNYKVISNKNSVAVLEDGAFPLYTIDEQTLQELATIEGSACSACILHLSDASVLPTNVLYKIAFYIQKHYPYLYIDWFTTFYYVEKESYLKQAFNMKELLEDSGAENENGQREKRFSRFESYELVNDIDTIILKIVMMNIITFNVIVK